MSRLQPRAFVSAASKSC